MAAWWSASLQRNSDLECKMEEEESRRGGNGTGSRSTHRRLVWFGDDSVIKGRQGGDAFYSQPEPHAVHRVSSARPGGSFARKQSDVKQQVQIAAHGSLTRMHSHSQPSLDSDGVGGLASCAPVP